MLYSPHIYMLSLCTIVRKDVLDGRSILQMDIKFIICSIHYIIQSLGAIHNFQCFKISIFYVLFFSIFFGPRGFDLKKKK